MSDLSVQLRRVLKSRAGNYNMRRLIGEAADALDSLQSERDHYKSQLDVTCNDFNRMQAQMAEARAERDKFKALAQHYEDQLRSYNYNGEKVHALESQLASLRKSLDSKGEALDQEVYDELARAVAKFPTWPTDPLHALAVLGEEFGELTKSMLQFVYEPHKTTRNEIRKEAVQTAAMALRLVRSLSIYDYAPSGQHSQSLRAAIATEVKP